MLSNFELRLKHLEDNIEQDLALRKQYEDELRYEDDPRRKARYERNIKRLQESAESYQQELDELQGQISTDISLNTQNVKAKLQQIDSKLTIIMNGQIAIYEDLERLRQLLLSRYEIGEKRIIDAVTKQLNQSNLLTIQAALDALEANQLSEVEMQHILQGTQQMITILQQKGTALPPEQQALVEVLNAPGLDTKHRLKVSLPIIPFLLDYEGELELGTGFNLKAAWQQFRQRLRG
ncbi:MAG: hypothetical protein F6J92_32310 [Symploca sp. SIO1A3]|nr:hypothetical protein [Symploca sp. SIO1A3]